MKILKFQTYDNFSVVLNFLSFKKFLEMRQITKIINKVSTLSLLNIGTYNYLSKIINFQFIYDINLNDANICV